MENKDKNRLLFSLFEEKGKYQNLNKVSLVMSLFMLIIDVILCIANFPYVRMIFNCTILFSAIAILTYLISDHKLEMVQKKIIYFEDETILNEKNINRYLDWRDINKINKCKKHVSLNEDNIKLIKNISLDTLIYLKENLESDKKIIDVIR